MSGPSGIGCHIVLLGDSIFDDADYVGGGPDVVAGGVPHQLDRLPVDATELVISAGGNDALGGSGVLRRPARSVADAVGALVADQASFAAEYGTMLDAVLALIDRRLICDRAEDHGNPIESSVRGGARIAAAIAGLHDVQDRLSVIATPRGQPKRLDR